MSEEIIVFDDNYFMRAALREAERAYDEGEVPVGAVIVSGKTILARAHNLTERLTDFTAHAEMQVLTAAAENLGSKFLNDCTLYVTLEPCVMCAGASFWTRVGKIVYGATDDKRGYGKLTENVLHPKTEVVSGVMAEECGEILSRFFREKRR